MRRGLATLLFALAGWLAGSGPSLGEPFQCPRVGGNFTFGQEAPFGTLDQMASTTIATRNIAMNIYETLMTRDEDNRPILDLAESMTEAQDRMTYTFRLRAGVRFHNGKPLTSADVVASFNRYARMGAQRQTLANVDRWDAPDPATFVLHMKRVQPTFLEAVSAYSAPIVIMPAEDQDAAAQSIGRPIGTGPFQYVDTGPGSTVKLRRFDGYQPNAGFQQRTGLGGFKRACLDRVTFRIVSEQGARISGLRSGELHAVEDLPARSLPDLKKDPKIRVLSLPNWWIQIANPNVSAAPTDNPLVRKAIQTALDMDEIMDAAAEGEYRLHVGFQFPNQPAYTDAGKQTYNVRDPARAKRHLIEAGYQGEPVVLLTNTDYPSMYNAALVVQQQLQAIGVNAQMRVVDWPTSVQMAQNTAEGWNFHFSAWGTQPALGPLATMQFLVMPNATYKPGGGQDDPDLLAAWNDMNELPTPDARQDAFARMQRLALERVYALPFGSLTKIQGVRAEVKGFVPFRVPRMFNVWIAN